MVMTNGLSANQLKTIAILAMTLDHLAWTLFPGYSTEWFVILLHIIGRITAPVMWFFVAEGYYHTRNIHNYMKRMFLLHFSRTLPITSALEFPFFLFKTPFLIRPV